MRPEKEFLDVMRTLSWPLCQKHQMSQVQSPLCPHEAPIVGWSRLLSMARLGSVAERGKTWRLGEGTETESGAGAVSTMIEIVCSLSFSLSWMSQNARCRHARSGVQEGFRGDRRSSSLDGSFVFHAGQPACILHSIAAQYNSMQRNVDQMMGRHQQTLDRHNDELRAQTHHKEGPKQDVSEPRNANDWGKQSLRALQSTRRNIHVVAEGTVGARGTNRMEINHQVAGPSHLPRRRPVTVSVQTPGVSDVRSVDGPLWRAPRGSRRVWVGTPEPSSAMRAYGRTGLVVP